MIVDIKTTKALVKKVLGDIDKFNNKTAGEPEWKYFHEIENDQNMPNNLREFAANFNNPPSDGKAQKMIDYYTNALKQIKEAGIDPELVDFVTDDEFMTVGMIVTPTNNTSNLEYYKEIVFNKGQLISFQKENARSLAKVDKVYEDYIEHLDIETKTKLNKIHSSKIQHFKEIDNFLSDAVAKVTEEEIKYKRALKFKK